MRVEFYEDSEDRPGSVFFWEDDRLVMMLMRVKGKWEVAAWNSDLVVLPDLPFPLRKSSDV